MFSFVAKLRLSNAVGEASASHDWLLTGTEIGSEKEKNVRNPVRIALTIKKDGKKPI